jgi:hypothetical protein
MTLAKMAMLLLAKAIYRGADRVFGMDAKDRLRHARFAGIRTDKDAREVREKRKS